MHDYRVYFLTVEGRIFKAAHIECASDAEALSCAATMQFDGCGTEVWERARMVGRLPGARETANLALPLRGAA